MPNDTQGSNRRTKASIRDALDSVTDAVTAVPGSGTDPFTMIPHWIRYGFSPQAQAIWAHIRDLLFFVEGPRRRTLTEVDRDELGAVAGVSKRRVGPYIAELVEGHALDVERVPGPGTRYRYRVNTNPPADWTGPLSIHEWLERRSGSETAGQAKEDETSPLGGRNVPLGRTKRPSPPLSIETQTHTDSGGQSPRSSQGSQRLETDTSVCVETSKTATEGPRPSQRARDTLEAVLHYAAAKKLGNADRSALEARIDQLLTAGWTTSQIRSRLDGTTDADTRIPAHPRGLLVTSIDAMESEGAPGSTSAEVDSSRADADVDNWPNLEPHQRPCGGRDCSDASGKRYVSIDQPQLGAYSCPTCRKAYQRGEMPDVPAGADEADAAISDDAAASLDADRAERRAARRSPVRDEAARLAVDQGADPAAAAEWAQSVPLPTIERWVKQGMSVPARLLSNRGGDGGMVALSDLADSLGTVS